MCIRDSLSSVTTCDEQAAQSVIEYLAKKGHTSIGVVGGNPVSYTHLFRLFSPNKSDEISSEQAVDF